MSTTPGKITRFFKRLVRSASLRYPVKKPVMWFIVFFYVCSGAFVITLTPARIAQFTYDASQHFRNLPYGYMLLILVMIVASFPPFIGHGILLYLFGFTYGIRGVIPAVIGTLVASVIVFVTLRMMFSKRQRLWTPTHEKWQALEVVIRSRGMPLIILIRMSSLVPWAWSNSLFASISSVSLLQFFIATCFVVPRIVIQVFIGSRIARLSNSKQRSRNIAQARFFNGFLIIGGILSTILASSLVYYFVQKEIKHLRVSSSKRDETAAETFGATQETAFSDSTV